VASNESYLTLRAGGGVLNLEDIVSLLIPIWCSSQNNACMHSDISLTWVLTEFVLSMDVCFKIINHKMERRSCNWKRAFPMTWKVNEEARNQSEFCTTKWDTNVFNYGPNNQEMKRNFLSVGLYKFWRRNIVRKSERIKHERCD
jgi:hypothetical protein